MAISKALIASILVTLVLVHLVDGLQFTPTKLSISNRATGTTTGNVITDAKIDCAAACGVRCSATKRPNLCKRACGSCCRECSCVPPGTSGNYETCPCYANKTTHGNIRKCP